MSKIWQGLRKIFNPTNGYYSERELAYLSESQDLIDLELRQKEIDRSRAYRPCVGL